MAHSPPIPLPNLKQRFSPLFSHIRNSQDATLLSLPHTGRTSLFRYIASRPDIFPPILLIDCDSTANSLSSYLSEILAAISSSPESKSILLSQDEYLIFQQIRAELKSRLNLTLILTLKSSCLPFLSDLSRLMVMLQKSAPGLRIIWSIDTSVYRSFVPSHPSSSFGKNVIFFPTFSSAETLHSLTRHFYLKGQQLPASLSSSAEAITGGIAGLFHPLVDSFPNFSLSLPQVTRMLTAINNEVSLLSPLQQNLLATSKSLSLLSQISPPLVEFQDFLFKAAPSAQEISLLALFKTQPSRIFSRDEIAQSLWGANWQSQYSDWAIDKAVSRLRANLASPRFHIITVKNQGYRLISL